MRWINQSINIYWIFASHRHYIKHWWEYKQIESVPLFSKGIDSLIGEVYILSKSSIKLAQSLFIDLDTI